MPKPDLSEFEEISRDHPARCKIIRLLDELSSEDREKCEAAIAAPHIGHNTIATWLSRKGLRIGQHAVRAHRKGECCCA